MFVEKMPKMSRLVNISPVKNCIVFVKIVAIKIHALSVDGDDVNNLLKQASMHACVVWLYNYLEK